MLNHIYRAWVIPEKRMIKSDLEFTSMCLKYLGKNENGSRDEIGFLADFEGQALDFQMYLSKQDMNGELVCDGDVIYCQDMQDTCRVVFNGSSFELVARDDVKGALLSDLPSDRIVIMGNVYEGMRK